MRRGGTRGLNFEDWANGARAPGGAAILGLARNERLVGAGADGLAATALESLAQRSPARRFVDFAWRTPDSWGRQRRVSAKAEMPKGGEPRLVVTSRAASKVAARTRSEDICGARG